MKKIVIFIPTLYPSGGAERVAHNLGNDLSELGHEVHMVTLGSNSFVKKSYAHTLLREEKGAFSKIISYCIAPFLLARYCKNNNIDAVMSHMERANVIALLAKKVHKTKTISVVHNHKYISRWRNKALARLLYPTSDIVISVSKGIEQELRDQYHITNTKTIYNYFDLKNIKQDMEKALEPYDLSLFNEGVYTFISIGRLTKQKGHDILIKAFRGASIPRSQLLIIGSGEMKKELEEIIGSANNIHLLGTRQNVFPLLSHSDCFVLPSRWEGFGLVLVEALLSGLPIISSDCKVGPREILAPKTIGKEISYPHTGTFGTLLEVEHIGMLVQALTKKPNKKNRQKLVAATEAFSKDTVLSCWDDLIQSLDEEKSS